MCKPRRPVHRQPVGKITDVEAVILLEVSLQLVGALAQKRPEGR